MKNLTPEQVRELLISYDTFESPVLAAKDDDEYQRRVSEINVDEFLESLNK